PAPRKGQSQPDRLVAIGYRQIIFALLKVGRAAPPPEVFICWGLLDKPGEVIDFLRLIVLRKVGKISSKAVQRLDAVEERIDAPQKLAQIYNFLVLCNRRVPLSLSLIGKAATIVELQPAGCVTPSWWRLPAGFDTNGLIQVRDGPIVVALVLVNNCAV